MATEIYCFSGTGNSLHVARELQKRLPGSELLPIVALVGQESVAAKGDTVGFVFPHYASSLPTIVETFVEKLDLGPANYLFAIVTRGGTRTMAFSEMDKILKRKGRRLDSFFVLTMPAGTEPLIARYDSKITEERIGRLASKMLTRLDSIQATITHRDIHRNEDIRAATPYQYERPVPSSSDRGQRHRGAEDSSLGLTGIARLPLQVDSRLCGKAQSCSQYPILI